VPHLFCVVCGKGGRSRTPGAPGLDFQTWDTTNLNRLQSYTDDAAGNMTYDGFNTYTYDAEGNITAVTGNASATYVYNALNQRVRTTVSSGTPTEFVFNANGQRVSEWNGTTRAQLKGKYYWGGTPVAYYTTAASGSAGAHFEHQDWLGTERMRTTYNSGNNPTYAVEGTFTSLPWGDDQAVASGTDLDANHYATLDYDAETNTDHAQFRQYGDTAGNWKSPDPYYGSYDFSNPQSMNRYVYAMDNPLSYIDPSGLFTPVPCDEDGTACPQPPFPPPPPDPCSMDSFLPWCADPPCSGSDFYGFNCDPGPPPPVPQKPSCGNGANCAPNNQQQNPCGTSCHAPNRPKGYSPPPSKDVFNNCQKVGLLSMMFGWMAGPWFEGAAGWFTWGASNTVGTATTLGCMNN